MKLLLASVTALLSVLPLAGASAQEAGDILDFEFSCVSPEFALGLVQSEPKNATVLMEKLTAAGKCVKYRATVSGVAVERIAGVFKDFYKDPIEIWKVETPRGQQYIIIYDELGVWEKEHTLDI